MFDIFKYMVYKLFGTSYYNSLYVKVNEVNHGVANQDSLKMVNGYSRSNSLFSNNESSVTEPYTVTELLEDNTPTPAQIERLDILIEECAEVITSATAIKRFGFESKNPNLLLSDTNRDDLAREIGDLTNIINMIKEANDVDPNAVSNRVVRKANDIKKWLKHQ